MEPSLNRGLGRFRDKATERRSATAPLCGCLSYGLRGAYWQFVVARGSGRATFSGGLASGRGGFAPRGGELFIQHTTLCLRKRNRYTVRAIRRRMVAVSGLWGRL